MEISEATLKAVTYSFEKARGISYGEQFEEMLIDSGVAGLCSDEIVRDISSFIDSNLESDNVLVPSAIFALGKKYDEKLKGYLVGVMKKSIDTTMLACYQAAIAVENLGERIFRDDASSYDMASNKIQIERFLSE